MALVRQPVHRLNHPLQEEGLGLRPPAMSSRRGDEFLRLGNGEGREEVGKDRP